ncbi:MAG: TolC family protein [Desulfobacterales bacterium CG07_land_8_20_14_0_80_52_14]|nr:MAG: transporter [Desulfobacterales bacterium CG23_combo_of_CG06-09_8_20_14_all_52_9]PIU49950.1 MAG: TolC family protein [Desulfobacterales bacterium CG07_land_8_20_14_0_80_52_14]
MKSLFILQLQFILIGVLVFLCLFCSGVETLSADRTPPSYGISIQSGLNPDPGATPVEKQANEVSEKGPLRISLMEAILMAIQNNRTLAAEKITPYIQQTYEEQERAKFDPVLGGEFSTEQDDGKKPIQTGAGIENLRSTIYEGTVFLNEFFPSGTDVEIGIYHQSTDSSGYKDLFSSTRLGLFVTQSLLKGYGLDANLVTLRQTRIQTDITRYELRGFVESLVAQVETAYWDYALSQRQIEIVEESLKVAHRQLEETEEMIKIGTMAEAELAALQAEVAIQQQGLINAKSNLESSRLHLLQLLTPSGTVLYDRDVILIHPPTLPNIKMDEIQSHVLVALKMRPEINHARLSLQQKGLEVVRTKNGLLPKMDLFISLGKTGYADSFAGSVSDIGGESYDALIGARIESPFFNRSAKAEHRRSLLQKDQAEKALENLENLVELDVRNAFIEMSRSKEQIAASVATRKFQEEKLRIETEKFRVGRSTNLFVAQAQRDLLASRIGEVQALVNYLKSLTRFYQLEGSLLERRGIQAPGGNNDGS